MHVGPRGKFVGLLISSRVSMRDAVLQQCFLVQAAARLGMPRCHVTYSGCGFVPAITVEKPHRLPVFVAPHAASASEPAKALAGDILLYWH